MKLLIINGNTSRDVTERIAGAARRYAAADTEIVAVTASFGADVIGSHAEQAIAQHAVLDAAAASLEVADAVLVAVSLDTAVDALREISPVPVVGMTEAALMTACMLGGRFGLVVFGPSMAPIYDALVSKLGLRERLAAVRALDATARTIAGREDALDEEVTRAAHSLCREQGADVVIVIGAVAAGMPERIRDAVPVPVLDGVACGVLQAECLARLSVRKPTTGTCARPGFGTVTGVSEALAEVLRDRG